MLDLDQQKFVSTTQRSKSTVHKRKIKNENRIWKLSTTYILWYLWLSQQSQLQNKNSIYFVF